MVTPAPSAFWRDPFFGFASITCSVWELQMLLYFIGFNIVYFINGLNSCLTFESITCLFVPLDPYNHPQNSSQVKHTIYTLVFWIRSGLLWNTLHFFYPSELHIWHCHVGRDLFSPPPPYLWLRHSQYFFGLVVPKWKSGITNFYLNASSPRDSLVNCKDHDGLKSDNQVHHILHVKQAP